MKYIITENRLKHLIDRFISNQFGKLTEKKFEKYPESRYWVNNDGNIKMELDEFGDFWVGYVDWETISDMFSLNYDETEKAIGDWVEDYLNVKGVIPASLGLTWINRWKRMSN